TTVYTSVILSSTLASTTTTVKLLINPLIHCDFDDDDHQCFTESADIIFTNGAIFAVNNNSIRAPTSDVASINDNDEQCLQYYYCFTNDKAYGQRIEVIVQPSDVTMNNKTIDEVTFTDIKSNRWYSRNITFSLRTTNYTIYFHFNVRNESTTGTIYFPIDEFKGSDFRIESNISKKYRDDEPPTGFGHYLFAAVIMNHPSIEYFRHTGTTNRGTNLSNTELAQYVPDARILTRSFLSTSKRIDAAFLYLQFDNPILRPVLCVYRIIQRHAGLAISKLSAVQDENEVLIVPFVAFRIVKVDLNRLNISSNRKASVIFLDKITVRDQKESMAYRSPDS
ncbi:unnamed protein product, partial [Didymodactylos carnosus]